MSRRTYIFILSLLCLGTAVTAHYLGQSRLQIAYRLCFVLMLGFCGISRFGWAPLLTRGGLRILLSGSVLGIFLLAGHGDHMLQTCTVFIRAVPFFVFGYLCSSNQVIRFRFLLSLTVVYTAIAIPEIAGLSQSVGGAISRNEVAAAIQGSQLDEEALSTSIHGMIYHYPTVAFLMILAVQLVGSCSGYKRVVILIMLGILGFNILVSTWTAAAVIMVSGCTTIALLVFFNKGTAFRQKLTLVTLAAGILVGLVGYVGLVGAGDESSTSKFARRLTQLGTLLTGRSADFDINELTGGRLDLAVVSFRTFSSNPLVGVGDNYLSVDVGGHSSVFDALARYGLAGALPLLTMFGAWLIRAIYCWRRHPNGLEYTTHLVFLAGLYASAFLNPYLFTCSLDFLLFYVAGVISAPMRPISETENAKAAQKHGRNVLAGSDFEKTDFPV